jgi:hypothetical protein
LEANYQADSEVSKRTGALTAQATWLCVRNFSYLTSQGKMMTAPEFKIDDVISVIKERYFLIPKGGFFATLVGIAIAAFGFSWAGARTAIQGHAAQKATTEIEQYRTNAEQNAQAIMAARTSAAPSGLAGMWNCFSDNVPQGPTHINDLGGGLLVLVNEGGKPSFGYYNTETRAIATATSPPAPNWGEHSGNVDVAMKVISWTSIKDRKVEWKRE